MAPPSVFASALLGAGFVFSNPISPRDVTTSSIFSQITPSRNLTWSPCLDVFFCAVLDVPLDYTNPSLARAFVPLLKYPASTMPYRGMILTNPGGPGESAIDFLSGSGPSLSAIAGSNYDFVAFEPRGIGYSIPLANCSGPQTTAAGVKSRNVLSHLDNFYGPIIPEQFFEIQFNLSQALGEKCLPTIGGANEAGPHMTTATVAKDIISIVDAYASSSYSRNVTNPAQVNYWGFSYGTYLGQVLASLYPQRMNRIVLDGVVDAEDYTSGANLNDLQYTDIAFASFFQYCYQAGPSVCVYSTNTTAYDIFLRFEATINRLNVTLAVENNWANASVIAYGLEATKFVARYIPYNPITGFPTLAALLLYLEDASKNISLAVVEKLENLVGVDVNLGIPGQPDEWLPAVVCSDNGGAFSGKTLEEFGSTIRTLESTSFIGGELWAGLLIKCTGWLINGTDRFAGPFGGKTKSPILFVSNTRDPVTPIDNGINANKIFTDSHILTIDATGHTSQATNNTCAFTKIGQYFQTGKLVGRSHCNEEPGPWGLVLNNGSEGGRRGLASEFKTILKGLRGLGR